MCSCFAIADIALLFNVLQKILGERLGAKGERLGIAFFQGPLNRDFAVENLSNDL
jgi:hypothetical protein